MTHLLGRDDAAVVHRFVQQRNGLLVLNDLHRIKPAGLISARAWPERAQIRSTTVVMRMSLSFRTTGS
jgi:hypothetical protein